MPEPSTQQLHQRQTRSRSRMANAPPLMTGLNHKGQATEPLPKEVPYGAPSTKANNKSSASSKKRKRDPLKLKLEGGRWKKLRTGNEDSTPIAVVAAVTVSSDEKTPSSTSGKDKTIVVDVQGSIAAMRASPTPPNSPITAPLASADVCADPVTHPEQYLETEEKSPTTSDEKPSEPELEVISALEPQPDETKKDSSSASKCPVADEDSISTPESDDKKAPTLDEPSLTESNDGVAIKLEDDDRKESVLQLDQIKQKKRGIQSTGDDLAKADSENDSFRSSKMWDSADTLPDYGDAMAHASDYAQESSVPHPPTSSGGGSHDAEDGTLQDSLDDIRGYQSKDETADDPWGLGEPQVARRERLEVLAPPNSCAPLPRCKPPVVGSPVCWTVGQPGSLSNTVWDARRNNHGDGCLDSSDGEDEHTDWSGSDG